MAELVNQHAEEMLPELEQMQRVGLFSTAEIKAVIKKRSAHEYKLVRKTKVMKDFLAYIQYEVNFLGLIHKRRKREHYFFKQDEIEYAIVARIHRLFKQMISRWPEDLKLWISHAKFCIKWNKKVQLSKLCTRIVQVHASNPKVWILAAKWELECGDAMDKVRALFLRSFKLHLTSPEIWHEYFRAELLFAEKLQKRFKILTREDTSLNDDVGENALMKGKAAKTVYTNAIKNFPNDVNVHLKFLDILSDFIGSTDFALPLFNELKDDLGELNCNDAKMRACLAKLHLKENLGIAHEGRDKALEKKSRISNCYREFDQALSDINNDEMWGEYFDFALSLCNEYESQENSLSETGSLSSMVAERFLKLAEHAHNGKHLNASRYVSWIDFLLQCGDAFRAFNVISDVCDSNNDPELWLKRLQIAHLVAVENDVDLELLFNKTLPFAKQMTRKQQCTFWSLWMHSCVAIDAESQAEDLITKKSVGCCSEALGILQHIYLSWVALKYDVNHAYQSFLWQVKPTRNPTAEQYKDVLKLLHSSPNIKQAVVKECYEFALQDHGSNNPDLWISYVQSLTEANKARKCGEIYWRAVKSLKPELTETFVAKYSLINCPIGS